MNNEKVWLKAILKSTNSCPDIFINNCPCYTVISTLGIRTCKQLLVDGQANKDQTKYFLAKYISAIT